MVQNTTSSPFKPVIAVVGHVDHGKTTLLDAIRKTDVTAREKGGITQSIGATEVEVDHEGQKRTVTLIDTPGHEAFANMRTQGVSAADIVLLVIAADDGIKPQTKESIDKIKEAQIPFIVVITKIDTQGANIEKVKQEVTKEGILLEGMGGNVPVIGVSAPKGEKIKDLLDLIILSYDIQNIEKSINAPTLAVVIDARLDKKKGITTSVIVKEGTLKVQDIMYTTHKEIGKIRALFATNGQQVKEAYPGDAVEILGATEVVPSGSTLFTNAQAQVTQQTAQQTLSTKDVLARLTKKEEKTLRIILKTKTSAESEAVKNALPESIEVVNSGQGDISTSEIMMAKDLGALVIGFNVAVEKGVQALAQSDDVFYKSYGIIYELLDEVQDVADALAAEGQQKELGMARIIAKFGEGDTPVLGLEVQSGRLALGDTVKLKRGEKTIGNSKIVSLKRGKADVKEVARDLECGARLENSLDFIIGDAIIAYK